MNDETAFAAMVVTLLVCCSVAFASAVSCQRQRDGNQARVDCVKAGKTADDCAKMIQP